MTEGQSMESGLAEALRENAVFPIVPAGVHIRYAIGVGLEKVQSRLAFGHLTRIDHDFQRAIAAMDWVNRMSRHDGWGYVPLGSNNLLDTLGHAATKPVCCFDLALALAELCLTLGLRARFVRCRPMDYMDLDSHVVTHVHLPSVGKWVLMDPTYNLFYMDRSGTPMSLYELRASIANGESVSIYPGARYNNVTVSDRQAFTRDKLTYMAKNTFWFDSLDTNCLGAFDSYCRGDPSVRYIFLAPEGYNARSAMLKNQAHREEFVEHADMESKLLAELRTLNRQWWPILQRMSSEGIQCSYDEFWDVKVAT